MRKKILIIKSNLKEFLTNIPRNHLTQRRRHSIPSTLRKNQYKSLEITKRNTQKQNIQLQIEREVLISRKKHQEIHPKQL